MATKKLLDWWNERADDVEARIEAAPDSEDSKDTYFYWSQLVWQELGMWENLGNMVGDSEMDFMVNRRGFTPDQRAFLVEGLTHLGLWDPSAS